MSNPFISGIHEPFCRMLAEFLTPKTLTLIITRTQSAVDALEVITNGQINRSVGLHGYARARGYTIPDTVFKVLALSDLQLDTKYGTVCTSLLEVAHA